MCVNASRGLEMTGKHLTDDQVVIYRATRQAHTLQHAAKIASISRSSASRIDNCLWAPQKHRSRRTRRRKLSGVWDGDALPFLAKNPRASAKDVYMHLRDVFPLLVSSAQRRTIERQYKKWKNEHGFTPLANLRASRGLPTRGNRDVSPGDLRSRALARGR